MEAKLIKNELPYGYFLYDEKGDLIASTIKGYKKRPLSLKNCEAIANGYDLDELVKSKYPNAYNEDFEYDSEAEMLRDEYKSRGFYEGAKAIIEILGDKKFSEEQMKQALITMQVSHNVIRTTEDRQELIQSLQQTEWDVDIVDEQVYDGLDEMAQPQYYKQPKLDADGCLTLKRI